MPGAQRSHCTGVRLAMSLGPPDGPTVPFPAPRIEGGNMSTLVKALIGLSALAFVLAVLTHFAGPLLGTHPRGYSSASTNLAVLAIALVLAFGDRVGVGRTL
jgi:hypothetical protein